MGQKQKKTASFNITHEVTISAQPLMMKTPRVTLLHYCIGGPSAAFRATVIICFFFLSLHLLSVSSVSPQRDRSRQGLVSWCSVDGTGHVSRKVCWKRLQNHCRPRQRDSAAHIKADSSRKDTFCLVLSRPRLPQTSLPSLSSLQVPSTSL
ncbi:hypothetical protein F5Y08DRAFT_305190 [Xylaria arbuscula]|nr:hypothetical protein F5Y08DRAFT_305190 [Xylaria arbuscula]